MGTGATANAVAAVAPARSGRFAINLVSNVGKLGLTMVVGVWYVPFLVRQLGPAAYGMIPLASMITSYMAFITFGLDAAMSRTLAISLERRHYDQANVIFNVAFWGNLAIAVLLAIPAVVAIAHVQQIVRIPAGYETATRWLFAGTVSAFLLNQVKTPFAASCFCLNRLDLQNVVTVGETLTRVGLVAFLFLVLAPRIEYVGAAILAGTIVSTLGAIWFWKALTPCLHIRLRNFDWTMLKSLASTGGWVIVSQIGVMLYLNIDLLLANRFFGPAESGRYAAVLQLSAMLSTLGMAVGEIFAPTMYQKYARGNLEELAIYLNRAIKFLGLVMALVIGLICGFSKPLLQLWLGPAFGSLAPLLCLMAIHLSLNLATYPLYAVPLAADRVKVPGLATLAVGVLNLALALLLTQVLGWGLYGLAAAGGISLTLRRFVFTPLYAAAILHQPYKTYYRRAVPIIGATLATIGLCRLVVWGWTISGWVDLGMAAMMVSLLFVATTGLLLPSEERAALKDIVVRWRD
ncbi:MAG TPA: oligosaccharide flippase family protein [Candidatus Binatia bacterium]|jgi:membrane protein EpsK|nr:oligosaccharide flippase family protein [Candidatus Binatia bacterium]